MRKQPKMVICQICKKEKKLSEVVPAELIHEPMLQQIKKTYPDWSPTGFICHSDLRQIRAQYINDILEEEKRELSDPEKDVVNNVEKTELLSRNINVEFDRKLTFGQRAADKMSDFAGSWRFIGIFIGVIFLWIAVNAAVIIQKPFDPYPFILLNLVLSCLAALQAPIIMMSQNRQEAKDRLRAEHDYRVNLMAELEIRHLHDEIGHYLRTQWQRLIEIQQLQIELMEELEQDTERGGKR
jgi:uncharacterized membrane protein